MQVFLSEDGIQEKAIWQIILYGGSLHHVGNLPTMQEPGLGITFIPAAPLDKKMY